MTQIQSPEIVPHARSGSQSMPPVRLTAAEVSKLAASIPKWTVAGNKLQRKSILRYPKHSRKLALKTVQAGVFVEKFSESLSHFFGPGKCLSIFSMLAGSNLYVFFNQMGGVQNLELWFVAFKE